jgi:AbrB family looped-hinge helix DNA binding protein
MNLKRKIGQKGQIVIPKVVRESLGIEPGDEVIMEIKEKEILIRPGVDPIKFVDDFCSIITKKLTRKVDLEKLIEEEVEERFALH